MDESQNDIHIPDEEKNGSQNIRWETHGMTIPSDPQNQEIAQLLKTQYAWFPQFVFFEAIAKWHKLKSAGQLAAKPITDTQRIKNIVTQSVIEPPKNPNGPWTITVVFYSKEYERMRKAKNKQKNAISTREILRLKEEKKKLDIEKITHDTTTQVREQTE